LTREREILEEIRDELRRIIRLLLAFLAPEPVPSTIVLTDPQGVPMPSLSLNVGQTDTTTVNVGDVNGVIIPGDVLDPGATVAVDDPAVASALLSADQTSVLVTALADGTANVTVAGTFGGATLTPGSLAVTVSTPTPPPPTAAEIVLTPGTPSAPAAPAAPATASGHAPDAGGQAPA